MRGIHDVFGVFFTPTPVNSVLYFMLIPLHQHHILVDVAVSCILLQISSLKHVTFQSFSFSS